MPRPAKATSRPSVRELIGLYGQLGRMLEAGLPATEALGLAARNSRGRVAAALKQTLAAVEGGRELANATAGLFPEAARVLLRAGEKTGGLPAAFHALATAAELRLDVRRQIVRACIFPFVLFTLVFFVPKAHLLFTAGWAAYLRACLVPYLASLGGLLALVLGLPRLLRLLLGENRSRRLIRALPVLHGLFELASRVRFCRNLASALEAGLNMQESLDLAARSTGDPRWKERLDRAAQFIARGGTLHQALERVKLLDAELLLAIASGERAGRLPESLQQQARLAQSTLGHRLNVSLQVLAVAILLLTYAFVARRVVSEYESVLGSSTKQMEKLLGEIGGRQGGELQKLLKELQSGEGKGDQGSALQQMLKQLGTKGGKGGKIDEDARRRLLEDVLKRAADPAGIEQLPPDVRKHLE